MNTSTTLTIVRHGKTHANEAGMLQGHSNHEQTHLTQQGLSQAQALGQALKNEMIDIIWSSDLTRARQTADAIRQHHPDAIFLSDPLLRERSYGIYEGQPSKSVSKTDRNNPPEGETRSDMYVRAQQVITQALAQYAGKNIVIVCHGGIGRSIIAAVQNIPVTDITGTIPEPSNTSKTTIRIYDSGEYHMVVFNDTSHLL